MKIELSRDEYLNLVKLVYLGNWVVNAIRTEDFDTGANEIEQKILSYAKDQNYEIWLTTLVMTICSIHLSSWSNWYPKI